MKKLLLTSVTALFLATGTTHAGRIELIPPEHYDYLFPGPIVIAREANLNELNKSCRSNVYRTIPACAERRGNTCQIYMLSDDFLKQFDETYPSFERFFKQTIRHEIGHCNGWSADHVGARLQGDCTDRSRALGIDCWPASHELDVALEYLWQHRNNFGASK